MPLYRQHLFSFFVAIRVDCLIGDTLKLPRVLPHEGMFPKSPN